jgi:hypothetical protein
MLYHDAIIFVGDIVLGLAACLVRPDFQIYDPLPAVDDWERGGISRNEP